MLSKEQAWSLTARYMTGIPCRCVPTFCQLSSSQDKKPEDHKASPRPRWELAILCFLSSPKHHVPVLHRKSIYCAHTSLSGSISLLQKHHGIKLTRSTPDEKLLTILLAILQSLTTVQSGCWTAKSILTLCCQFAHGEISSHSI